MSTTSIASFVGRGSFTSLRAGASGAGRLITRSSSRSTGTRRATGVFRSSTVTTPPARTWRRCRESWLFNLAIFTARMTCS
jgi:hypothetical protein